MRNICAFPIVFNLTRFLNTAQMAILPSKSRVAFLPHVEILAISMEKRLTSLFIPPTMLYRLLQ
jgi:hypothetical protein